MDILRRLVFWTLFTAIIAYLVYLFLNWIIIVNENFLDKNTIIHGLYVLIFLYYLIFYVLKPVYIKNFKLRNTLIWIFVITSSQSFLANNGPEWIYFADIFSVIWVLLTIIWPTNLLVSQKLKKESQEKKMEVIEV